jgi:type III pantothenate kinase
LSAPGLLLDLGNRHAKFARPDLAEVRRVVLDPARVEDSVREAVAAARALRAAGPLIAASVAPRWEEPLAAALAAAGAPPRWLRSEVIPIARRTRGTGLDRLLGAWRAHGRAGGAALVASLGTAFTLDAVDAQGVFRGGAIGPGLGVQEAALAAAAPHLPPSDPAWNGEGFPEDSAAAVACGTRGALAAALDARAAAFAALLGAPGCARFLTGGDAARVAPLLATDWRLEPDLVLAALAELAPRLA